MKTTQNISLIIGSLTLWVLIGCQSKKATPLVISASLPTFTVEVGDENVFDGYIFLRHIVSPGGQLMIDSKGTVQWFQVSDTTLFRPYTPYENSYVALYSDKVIHEISYEGDTLTELRYGENGFDRKLHHEVVKDPDGNYVALTREFLPVDLSSVGGEAKDTIKTDGIIVLSSRGEKLWHWKLDQVYTPLEFEGIEKYKKDWGHANALFIDDDGNYLISWRDFNAIWKIHSQTGEVLWKVDHDSFTDESHHFFQQHGVHRNAKNEVVFFDNGTRRGRGISRAYAFRDSQEVQVTNIIALPDSLFSFKQGSVYEFDNERWLFSSTMNKRLVITDKRGNIIWMASSDYAFYRAYYLDVNFLKSNDLR